MWNTCVFAHARTCVHVCVHVLTHTVTYAKHNKKVWGISVVPESQSLPPHTQDPISQSQRWGALETTSGGRSGFRHLCIHIVCPPLWLLALWEEVAEHEEGRPRRGGCSVRERWGYLKRMPASLFPGTTSGTGMSPFPVEFPASPELPCQYSFLFFCLEESMVPPRKPAGLALHTDLPVYGAASMCTREQGLTWSLPFLSCSP